MLYLAKLYASDVEVLAKHEQYITAKFSKDGDYNRSLIYLWINYASQRKELWKHTSEVSEWNKDPWMSLTDNQGGTNRIYNAMGEFEECITQAGLDDLRHSRLFYTWQKNCGSHFIRKKLDRVLINDE